MSGNPGADNRGPMTFEQQAELLEYFVATLSAPMSDGTRLLSVTMPLDQGQVDDLAATAKRLRRMVGYDDAIRELVTGH